MKKMMLSIIVFFICGMVAVHGQSFPNFKDNKLAQAVLYKEIDKLSVQLKNDPTLDLERKITLYSKALSFLQEPTEIPQTTSYAVTSAFLNSMVEWYNISDTDAYTRLISRNWVPEFTELVNILKS